MYISMNWLRLMSKYLLVLMLMNQVCSGQKIPEWIMGRPEVPGEISTVASGEFKLDALVKALGDLALQNDAKVESLINEYSGAEIAGTRDVNKSQASMKIGDIEIKWNSKQFLETSDQGGESLTFSQDWCQINLQKDSSNYTIKYFNEITTEEEKENSSHSLHTVGENLSFKDLLGELKTAGVQMKSYEDTDAYYILLFCSLGHSKQ